MNSVRDQPLTDLLIQQVTERGGVKRYASQTVIISEGDVATTLYLILSGRVRVYSSSVRGKEVTIATYGPGEYIGELALDGEVRSASVMTLEPTTCAVVSGASLLEFIEAHPDFAMHLIFKLIWRVRRATDSVKSLALQDVYERVFRLLNDLAVPDNGRRVVVGRLTQQDIADRVGSSREMVSRIFRDLVADGYLAREAQSLVILKRPTSAR